MDEIMQGFIQSVVNDTSYDYIANNYYMMTQTDLKNILLEYIFYIYEQEKNDNYTLDDLIESLKERYI